jgi:hypothetical protein
MNVSRVLILTLANSKGVSIMALEVEAITPAPTTLLK